MGTTSNYSWPYPESSDFVADGATAIEDLADAVDQTLGGTTFNVNTSTGQIGIGTASPSAELDIRGASNPEIRFQSTDGSDPFIYFGDQVDPVRGGIGFDTSENNLVFRRYNNITAMTLTPSGYLGINDSSPSYYLDVNGTARFTGQTIFSAADGVRLTGVSGGVQWDDRNGDGSRFVMFHDGNSLGLWNGTATKFQFLDNGVGIASVWEALGDVVGNGNVQSNQGVTVGAIASANSINTTYAQNSSIQFATDTYWGGANNAHTGFLMWCGGMNGWSTAQLGFRVGNNWGSYHAHNPLRLAGVRTYINLGGESTYNLYADGGGRIGFYSSRRELKNHVADIAPADALARIMQLQPIDFTWKKEHRPEGDLANELIDFNVHRGFYAEDAAAVDVTYGTYGWVASEQDAEGGEVSHLESITEPLEHYGKTLEDAVVVSYDDKAILADLVGSVKALESRIAQLETTA